MYELLFIVPTRYTDTEVADIQKKVTELIVKFDGKIVREENLGRIKLAYPIKQSHHGSYLLAFFEAPPASVKLLEDQLRLTDEVLRHLLLVAEPDAEKRPVKLEAYVAPLSEEAEGSRTGTRGRRERDGGRVSSSPAISDPTQVSSVATSEAEIPMKKEKEMSMEEIDKKLDEILEEDVTDKT